MKRLISVLLIAAMLLACSGIALASKSVYTTGKLNLRTGAGKDYHVITTIPKNTKISVYGQRVDDRGIVWYKTSYNGHEGYVSSMYTSDSKSGEETKHGTETEETGVVITTGSANIRSRASLSGTVLCSVSSGKKLTYLNESQKDSRGVRWYKVWYKGTTGWISSKYSYRK